MAGKAQNTPEADFPGGRGGGGGGGGGGEGPSPAGEFKS